MQNAGTCTDLDDVHLSDNETRTKRRNQNQSTQTVNINKEEFDKQCAKYSTGGFLLGIIAISLYGVLML